MHIGESDTGEFTYKDENGLGYVMSETGRHERTVDLETGVTLLTFGYDTEDRLVSVTDRFNQMTAIRRDADGTPYEIECPDGIVTQLTVDEYNQLRYVTYPDTTFYEFRYDYNDGLLTDKIEPKGNRKEHFFDDTGRVDYTIDQEGGRWDFAMAKAADSPDIEYTTTTAEGETTTYRDHNKPTGAYTSLITDPTGNRITYTESADGLSVERDDPCGMNFKGEYGLDPVFGSKYLETSTVTSPVDGLVLNLSTSKAFTDPDGDGNPETVTETMTKNGKTTTGVHDVTASTVTVTSPENRTVTMTYDSATLQTASVSVPDLLDTSFAYFADGRTESVTTGTRTTSYTYDINGHLKTVTDPDMQVTTYDYDIMGRLKWVDSPDTPRIYFDYDDNGNMRMISRPTTAAGETDPSIVWHTFDSDNVNLPALYTTPLSGSYIYDYDRQKRLTSVTFPSGAAIGYDYQNGRLELVTTPEGDIDYEYECGTKVSSIFHSTSGETLSYTYDGGLIKSEIFSGTLNETLEYGHNNDFDLETFTYAGVSDTFIYDNDGLLTNAGNYHITRKPSNGLPETVSDANLTIGRGFNGYGETDNQTYTVGGQTIASWAVTQRDQSGRITQKTETVIGELGQTVTDNYVYDYDAFGRLLRVTKNGTPVEEYAYDEAPYGTRTYEMNLQRGINGRTYTYDIEDRLDSMDDGTSFTFDSDGFLTSKTTTAGTTIYDYSSRGELLNVTLSDGRLVEYVHDPIGRRIAKTVNGTIVEKYLWNGRTQLLAVYNGDDSLKMRFEYADGRIPVSMTTDGQKYYLACDQVGSLRIVANQSGTVVKRIEYDTFGNITDDSDPLFEIPFGFAGGLHDRDTGLVRFGFRDYDSDTGRWAAKDPIRFAGGDTDLFGYCMNDPVNFIDEDGLTRLVLFRKLGVLMVDNETGKRGSIYFIDASTGGGTYTNNKDFESEKGGPIPSGEYTINVKNLTNPGFFGDILRNLHGDWGDWRVPIKPCKGTLTHGRSGFFLHGGSNPGSAGCVDIGGGSFGDKESDKILNSLLSDPDKKVPFTVLSYF